LENVWFVRLRYAPRAVKNIADIYRYIARHNETAAAAIVRETRATSRLLARFPGLGRETDIPEVRVFPISRFPYLVYHQADGDDLTIIHVRDARRDTPREHDL
jgi:toxin ParE1/3/4